MTTLLPEGAAVRKAVKWISEQRSADPSLPVHKLVDEAGRRFNLSPGEQDFLLRFCREQG